MYPCLIRLVKRHSAVIVQLTEHMFQVLSFNLDTVGLRILSLKLRLSMIYSSTIAQKWIIRRLVSSTICSTRTTSFSRLHNLPTLLFYTSSLQNCSKLVRRSYYSIRGPSTFVARKKIIFIE